MNRYRALAQVSTRTLAVARLGDWEGMTAEQERCRALVDELRGMKNVVLSREEQIEKRAIIVRLLAEDAEIRDLVQPWMKRLAGMLTAAGNERRLGESYGG